MEIAASKRIGNGPLEAKTPSSRVFDVAPEEDLLYSLSSDGTRKHFHPRLWRGRFWKIRRAIALGLFALFFALPLIPVGEHPAVLLDIATRRFHIFGATLHPTDNLMLAAFGLGVIVTIFFVGSTMGRVWCGFACPQTVYLEFLFRPIEALLEGNPAQQRKLNAAPWTGRKVGIKAAKWSIWAFVAVLMASTFVAYFVGWGPLLHGLANQPLAWKGALFTTTLLTVAILFDFGWFRDQMCTIACPYGRIQNVLADEDTILVAYDDRRGEPRVKAKDRLPDTLAGDCIDCRACVDACPTGTDIRRGLQPECIGEAQCVDACDEIMRSRGRPIGLIRFTSERQQQGGMRRILRPRIAVYLALMTVAWGSLAYLAFTRGDALVELVRGAREPYRLLPTGEVANQQRVRITNQLEDTQHFTVELLSPKEGSLMVSESPIEVEPEELTTVNAVTTVPAGVFANGKATARYLVTSDRGFRQEVEFLLLGPYTSAGGQP